MKPGYLIESDVPLAVVVAEVRGMTPIGVNTIITQTIQHGIENIYGYTSVTLITPDDAMHVLRADSNRDLVALVRAFVDSLARVNPRHSLDGLRCNECENEAENGDPDDPDTLLCGMHQSWRGQEDDFDDLREGPARFPEDG